MDAHEGRRISAAALVRVALASAFGSTSLAEAFHEVSLVTLPYVAPASTRAWPQASSAPRPEARPHGDSDA